MFINSSVAPDAPHPFEPCGWAPLQLRVLRALSRLRQELIQNSLSQETYAELAGASVVKFQHITTDVTATRVRFPDERDRVVHDR